MVGSVRSVEGKGKGHSGFQQAWLESMAVEQIAVQVKIAFPGKWPQWRLFWGMKRGQGP